MVASSWYRSPDSRSFTLKGLKRVSDAFRRYWYLVGIARSVANVSDPPFRGGLVGHNVSRMNQPTSEKVQQTSERATTYPTTETTTKRSSDNGEKSSSDEGSGGTLFDQI